MVQAGGHRGPGLSSFRTVTMLTRDPPHWLIPVGKLLLEAWPRLTHDQQLAGVIHYGNLVEYFAGTLPAEQLVHINAILLDMIGRVRTAEAERVRRN